MDIEQLKSQLPLRDNHGHEFIIADVHERMRAAARTERNAITIARTDLERRESELAKLEEIIRFEGYTAQQKALVSELRRSFDGTYSDLGEAQAIDAWAEDHAQLCAELGYYKPKHAAEWLWDEGYYHPSQFEVSR